MTTDIPFFKANYQNIRYMVLTLLLDEKVLIMKNWKQHLNMWYIFMEKQYISKIDKYLSPQTCTQSEQAIVTSHVVDVDHYQVVLLFLNPFHY